MHDKIEQNEPGRWVGTMTKRKELMEDGRRYIIYFSFGETINEAADPGRHASQEENV